jgi:hypothetical protein
MGIYDWTMTISSPFLAHVSHSLTKNKGTGRKETQELDRKQLHKNVKTVTVGLAQRL